MSSEENKDAPEVADAPPPPPPPAEAAPGGEAGGHNDVSVDPSKEDNTAQAAAEERSKTKQLAYFIYNPKSGRVLGRSGKSWLTILVFYIIYYLFVFAYFFLALLLLMQFAGSHKPEMTGSSKPTILGLASGLSVFPSAPSMAEVKDPKLKFPSSTIYYDINEKKSYEIYSDRLDKFYQNMSNKVSHDCGPNYGYDKGNPCVLIRFNRIFDWQPKSMKNFESFVKSNYKESDITRKYFERYQENLEKYFKGDKEEFMNEHVGIQCVKDGGDESALGTVVYYPAPGIPIEEFGKSQSASDKDKNVRWNWTPYLFVQFNNIKKNVLVEVICKAFEESMDLYYARDGVGAVRFSFYINDNKKRIQ